MRIVKYEAQSGNEHAVKKIMFRMLDCVEKTGHITEHHLSSPMVDTWAVQAAPNNEPLLQNYKKMLAEPIFDSFRNTDWFADILKRL